MKNRFSYVFLMLVISIVFGGISDCQQDNDGDGSTDDIDCNDSDPNIYPGALELCDHVDNDCDETVDNGLDNDGDGTTSCSGDCDDEDPAKGPQASDIPDDEIDNDCDGFVDDKGWEWGSTGADTAKAIALENDLVCIAGSTGGNLYQPSAGGSDAIVACFDKDGIPEFEWQFGFSSQDSFNDIVLSEGNVFVGGTVDEAAFVGSVTWNQLGIKGSSGNAVVENEGFIFLAGSEPTESGGNRAFVARYELDGTPAGKWILETGTKTSATGLAKRPSGGIIVVGHTDATVYGHIDGWLVEMTTDLEIVGDISVFGTSRDDFPHDVAIASNGSPVVVGNTYEENSYTQGFVTLVRDDGGWYVESGVDHLDDEFHGVITTDNNGFYAIGDQYDSLLLSQISLAHYDDSGVLLEKFIFGTPSDNDYGNGIKIDEEERIWITGSTGGPLFSPFQEGDKTTNCYVTPI